MPTIQTNSYIQDFMDNVKAKNPAEKDFHQAVHEVVESVYPYIVNHPRYKDAKILERMIEPDRIIIFRVCWEDDNGNTQINRGFRVQFSNAIGPYKGGLRFHPSVTLDTFKFLGFEQVFKNSLTTLPMGAAKGGSDFDPKGKSDREVMRFCQAFMTELIRHIGKDTDVPAGDIGVGAREIGYLFGQHKRLTNRFTGVLTGKSLEYGGSLIRKEATGYGCVFFVEEMLKNNEQSIEGKRCVVSGSGNVAQYTAEKVIQLGGTVVSFSDSSGTVYDPSGVTQEKLEFVKALKNERRGRIKEYADKFGCEFLEGKRPWNIECDVAFPSATQNELSLDDAKALVANGCQALGEGANMPTEPDAVKFLIENGVLFGPAKAANAGGVAVSGLEMTQNSMRISWDRNDLETRLQNIMKQIHSQCLQFSTDANGTPNYVDGANIAGFVKVADAMLSYGIQ
ncbi:MAG: NADP-specific glutamate dehydrogenase [Candidatus Margulisbacteria bacterium]|nr:NADP-specific glutamate dehydrogenase [Candidatus Margulisiibacteriota bacterium]